MDFENCAKKNYFHLPLGNHNVSLKFVVHASIRSSSDERPRLTLFDVDGCIGGR